MPAKSVLGQDLPEIISDCPRPPVSSRAKRPHLSGWLKRDLPAAVAQDATVDSSASGFRRNSKRGKSNSSVTSGGVLLQPFLVHPARFEIFLLGAPFQAHMRVSSHRARWHSRDPYGPSSKDSAQVRL